ncbi:MAG: hypothetical protein IJS71_01420 [Clostridia bacterium]|nr:hypothetical protein [Clostridia bacterium]
MKKTTEAYFLTKAVSRRAYRRWPDKKTPTKLDTVKKRSSGMKHVTDMI